MAESLTDIARKLNVAPSTISRAISDPSKVAPKTRAKILSYVEKVGYKPNLSARMLRMQRSTTIGIVVNDLSDSLIAQAANIMQDVAFKRGYFPVLLSTEESRTKERESISRLMMTNICGLVIIPSSATASILENINIPVVELDRSTNTNHNDEFRMDDQAAMQMATRYLHGQGCKHIAVFFGNIDRISSFKSRYLALNTCAQESLTYSTFFVKGVTSNELTSTARLITNIILDERHAATASAATSAGGHKKSKASADHDSDSGSSSGNGSGISVDVDTKSRLKELMLPISYDLSKLKSELPIDGMIAANHSLASGMVQGFNDHHLPLNKDIKLFTFDHPDWLSVLPEDIPSITHPLNKAADLAMNRLIDRIENKYTETVEARLLRPQLLSSSHIEE